MQWQTELKGNFQFHTKQIYYSYIFISSRKIEKYRKKVLEIFLFALFMAQKSIFSPTTRVCPINIGALVFLLLNLNYSF